MDRGRGSILGIVPSIGERQNVICPLMLSHLQIELHTHTQAYLCYFLNFET